MKSSIKVNIFFWLHILSYLITLYLKTTNVLSSGFWRSYFNDLICIPIILYCATWMLRLIFQQKNLKLDIAQIIFAVLVFSITFEWIAPKYYPIHTADILDVLCYTVGGIGFWYVSDKF